MGGISTEALLLYFNGTIPRGTYPNCTLKVDCQLDGFVHAQVDYYPSLGGNAFYLAVFAIFLIIQVAQGIIWKTWGYAITMALGLVLEVVGYGGRVALNENPYTFNSFLIYLICLTIAPVFFTASIYFSLARLIPIIDPTLSVSRLAPKTYMYLFISADFFSLVLQAIGGGLSASANTKDEEWTGIHIMIAGLAFQVLSLVVFSAMSADFAFRVYGRETTKESHHNRRSLHGFELALAGATVFILARSIYRCAELAGGFNGRLANEEVPFMILEGMMVILACLCLTIWHPGRVLKGDWAGSTTGSKGVDGSEFNVKAGNIGGSSGGSSEHTNL